MESRSPSEPISVIVCTKDRPDRARRLLQALDRQTRPPEEIIIVDGSRERTLEKSTTHRPQTRYLYRPEQTGLTQARNTGARAASGQICVFLDDDVVPEPTLLEGLAAAYQAHPDVGGVGGVPLERTPPSILRVFFLRLFQRGPFSHPVGILQRSRNRRPRRVRRLSGALQSYRREILERFQFDENLRGYANGEDMDFSWRVSREHPLLILPSERVAHEGLGWSSRDAMHRFENKVYSYAYHYRKNLRGHPLAALAFQWLLLGIAGEALFHSVATRSLGPLRGLRAAMGTLRRGLDGAGGFIIRDPRFLVQDPRRGPVVPKEARSP